MNTRHCQGFSPSLSVFVVGALLIVIFLTSCFDSALYEAAKGGDLQTVRQELTAGADPNAANPLTVDTPLIEAARHGHIEVAEVLIQHGANVNRQGEAWYTALHCAAGAGHADLVRLLLDQGADLTLFSSHDTALHSAVSAGQEEIVGILLEHGADPLAKGVDEATPLELAAGAGHVELVELFVSLGAEVNAQGLYGRTALHAAAWNDQVEAAQVLLNHGADPTLECNGRPVAGKSDRFRTLLNTHAATVD